MKECTSHKSIRKRTTPAEFDPNYRKGLQSKRTRPGKLLQKDLVTNDHKEGLNPLPKLRHPFAPPSLKILLFLLIQIPYETAKNNNNNNNSKIK